MFLSKSHAWTFPTVHLLHLRVQGGVRETEVMLPDKPLHGLARGWFGWGQGRPMSDWIPGCVGALGFPETLRNDSCVDGQLVRATDQFSLRLCHALDCSGDSTEDFVSLVRDSVTFNVVALARESGSTEKSRVHGAIAGRFGLGPKKENTRSIEGRTRKAMRGQKNCCVLPQPPCARIWTDCDMCALNLFMGLLIYSTDTTVTVQYSDFAVLGFSALDLLDQCCQ